MNVQMYALSDTGYPMNLNMYMFLRAPTILSQAMAYTFVFAQPNASDRTQRSK